MKKSKVKAISGGEQVPAKLTNKELAKAIGDNAYIQFRKAQMQELNGDRIGYHVSDYVGECMRRTALSKMYGEAQSVAGLKSPLRMEGVGAIYIGNVIHEHSDLAGIGHELALCYDVVKHKNVPFDKNGVPQIPKGRDLIDFIIGSCDDIIDDPLVGNVIVDKKTMDLKGFKPKKAYDHHIDQINYYRYLLMKCKKIDAGWGCSFYIDLDERTAGTFRFAYPLLSVDKIEKELMEKREKLIVWRKTNKLPERVLNWACDKYCSVASECFRRAD